MDEFVRVCQRLGVEPINPEPETMIGLALGTLGSYPINGLRHVPAGQSNGWYLWCGTDFSDDDDFFSPVHIEHLKRYLPEAEAYLALQPGYRFLIGDHGFEDVWFDSDLINT